MNKTMYWISTGLFSLFMLLTGIAYLTDPQLVETFQRFGFPGYFRKELSIAKMLGVLILIIPRISSTLKEWAYAGFAITLLSGAIAHLNSGDSFGYIINVIFWFALLVVSYICWRQRNNEPIKLSLTQS